MRERMHDIWGYIALAILVIVALILAGGAKAMECTWDSPISPITTPRPDVPTGFTPTAMAPILGDPPTTAEEFRPTPKPALTATPIMLLPSTGEGCPCACTCSRPCICMCSHDISLVPYVPGCTRWFDWTKSLRKTGR